MLHFHWDFFSLVPDDSIVLVECGTNFLCGNRVLGRNCVHNDRCADLETSAAAVTIVITGAPPSRESGVSAWDLVLQKFCEKGRALCDTAHLIHRPASLYPQIILSGTPDPICPSVARQPLWWSDPMGRSPRPCKPICLSVWNNFIAGQQGIGTTVWDPHKYICINLLLKTILTRIASCWITPTARELHTRQKVWFKKSYVTKIGFVLDINVQLRPSRPFVHSIEPESTLYVLYPKLPLCIFRGNIISRHLFCLDVLDILH